MNCNLCWNYENCETKEQVTHCFRKNESLCHYCKVKDCKRRNSSIKECYRIVLKDEFK